MKIKKATVDKFTSARYGRPNIANYKDTVKPFFYFSGTTICQGVLSSI